MPCLAIINRVFLLALIHLLLAEVPRPIQSLELARSLQGKLVAMELRHRSGPRGPAETVIVSEGELNSYLNLLLSPPLPQGVSDLDVRFERDRIVVRGLVDVEQLRARAPSDGSWSPALLLSGKVQAEVRGRYFGEPAGFGRVEIEQVQLGGFSVPVSFLEYLVSSSTKSPSAPNGVDIGSPFRLPWSVRRIRLQPGRAVLEQ